MCFRRSDRPIKEVIPIGVDHIWGDSGNSPRHSLDEYMDNEDLDDDESFTGPNAAGEKIDVKPILVGSPLGSPRGSIDLTIDSGVPSNAEEGNGGNSSPAEGGGEGGHLTAPPKKDKEAGAGSDTGSHGGSNK